MKAVLDRFEGDYAVLLVSEEEYEVLWPRLLLPRESGEGCWLSITLVLDPGKTRSREKRVADKLRRLENGQGT